MVEAAELKKWLGIKDETLRHEFKLKYVLKGQGNTKHRDELAKDVMALANTAGRTCDDYAYLVIGAGDKLKPDGTRDGDDVRAYGYSRESILSTVNAKCYPSLPDLAYEEVEVNSNRYGVIIIPPSPFRHELSSDLDAASGSWKKGMVPIRHGDEVAPASFQEMTLLNEEKASWGRTPESAAERLEEYLADPVKKTKARSLIIEEAKKLLAALNDPERLKRDDDHRYSAIVERMTAYEELTGQFLPVFAAGCYGGEEWLRSLWPEALTIIANPVLKPGAAPALRRLRLYPALLLLYGGGMAAVAGENYGNLAALLRRTEVRGGRPGTGASGGLTGGWVMRSDDEQHLAEAGIQMPFNYHVAKYLRTPLDRYVHSDERFMECLVRFEYLYSLASMAQRNGLIMGSFAWESEQTKSIQKYHDTNVAIVRDTEHELDRLGADWPPLKSGLFDGSVEQFRVFKKEADEKVIEEAGKFFFG